MVNILLIPCKKKKCYLIYIFTKLEKIVYNYLDYTINHIHILFYNLYNSI